MAFINILWDSLARTYATPSSLDLTTTASDATSHRDQDHPMSQRTKRQYSQQQAAQSQYSQPHSQSSWFTNQRRQRLNQAVASDLHARQHALPSIGFSTNAASQDNRCDGRTFDTSTDFAQPVVSSAPVVPKSSCTTSTTKTMNDQKPIACQPWINSAYLTQGGHAVDHWQQHPELSTKHPPATPLSPVAAEFLPPKSHTQVQHRESLPVISMTWQQLCLTYSQPPVQTRDSYLSTVGVPFDLGSLNGRRHTFSGVDAAQTVHSLYGREQKVTLPIASTCAPPISTTDNHAGPGNYAHPTSTSRKGRKTVRDGKMDERSALSNYKQLAQTSTNGRNDAARAVQSQKTHSGNSEMPRLTTLQHNLPKVTSAALHTPRRKLTERNPVQMTADSQSDQLDLMKSSTTAPPTKRVKGHHATVTKPGSISSHLPVKATAIPARAAGGWGHFAAHIAQDDQKAATIAREELKQRKGDTFRPEFRETYKGQKGQKETTVHKGLGRRVVPAATKSQNVDGRPKTEMPSAGTAFVEEPLYDADSSEGGVAKNASQK
ncbi:hypothetical protein E8E13_007247 [Curvularia kusanoi]|uniref:Uncharacterized protein n=1 Tax=Curvularia kusanoi TaxID=90978 RepID=A0A9P4TCC8_CURKU|nr:hypothetical protein E8E13_007247 [Curvularia kusanoi]